MSQCTGSSYILETCGYSELATSSPKQPQPFAPVYCTNTIFLLWGFWHGKHWKALVQDKQKDPGDHRTAYFISPGKTWQHPAGWRSYGDGQEELCLKCFVGKSSRTLWITRYGNWSVRSERRSTQLLEISVAGRSTGWGAGMAQSSMKGQRVNSFDSAGHAVSAATTVLHRGQH